MEVTPQFLFKPWELLADLFLTCVTRVRLDVIMRLFTTSLVPGCSIFCDFMAGWKFWAHCQCILHLNTETKRNLNLFPRSAASFLIYKLFLGNEIKQVKRLILHLSVRKGRALPVKTSAGNTHMLLKKWVPDLLIFCMYFLFARLRSPKWRTTSSLRAVFPQLSEHKIKQLFIPISFVL